MAKTRKTAKASKPVKIRRLTVRNIQRAAVHKTMMEYVPLQDTRFRCGVCGSVSSGDSQCCGEDTRKNVLAGR